MNQKLEENELYKSSHMMILLSYTLFTVILTGESLILGWEKWALMLLAAGLIGAWTIHIRRILNEYARLWIYSFLMMETYFFYGIHLTSTFDIAIVIIIVIQLYSMTGDKKFVTLCQVAFYITFGYDMVMMVITGEVFDSLVITRAMLHIGMVIMSGWVARTIIDKWSTVIGHSREEIEILKVQTDRLNNFLANVSHEIRTPVNAVMGLSAVLEKEELSESVRDNVTAISQAGHRVAEQIGDILDFTEIDMDKLTVSPETYMIDSIVNDLLNQLKYTDKYDLDLVVDLDATVPSELTGDGDKIRKILWHLIANGYKFTKTGGVFVRIYASEREYGVNLILEVRDTGVGMTPEEIEHIYEKFFQSNSGRTRAVGGLGIGIPIVYGFVSAMGGLMDISSTPGVGTTVRVSIPQQVEDYTHCMSIRDKENVAVGGFLGFMTTGSIGVREFYMEMITHLVQGLLVPFHRIQSRAELEKLLSSAHISHLFVGTGEYLENRDYIEDLSKQLNVAVVLDRDKAIDVGPRITLVPKPFYGVQIANFLNQKFEDRINTGEARMTCPGLKVLVVDDEPMNLLVARGIFESYGMAVDTAPSGEVSIEMCGRIDYDVVFMDHMMPEMDGVEAMKRLRIQASRKKKEICIVALTANAISSAREMFMSEGFDGFIPKPIEIADLERVLKHILPKSAIEYVYDETKEKAPALKDEETAESKPAAPEPAPVPSQEPAEEGVSSFDWLSEYGVDAAEGIRYCRGDEDFYKQLLLEYAGKPSEKADTLKTLYDSADWKNYTIRVHAIKSTSKMIGARSLSESAKKLEDASKAGDTDVINSLHPKLIEEYGRLLSAIHDRFAASDSSDGEVMEFAPKGGES